MHSRAISARAAGIVVAASAGNYGEEGYGTITSPGSAPSIITVGSLNRWGDNDPPNDIVSTCAIGRTLNLIHPG